MEAVKNTTVLPPERIRKTIATGTLKGGDRQYPCEDEAKAATNILLNRIGDTFQRIAGGSLNRDAILLTGGGSALLYQRLSLVLNHENVFLADDIESIHLANVRGGLKLCRLYEALQVL
ncbi:hypothetical protein ACFLV7_15550 [Chloroflexota bacterium]